MFNINKHITNGSNNTLKLINGTNFSYKGSWIQVYPNTEIDRWYVGDYSSANYTITVEFDSNKKETLQVLVVARPDQASLTVFGRTSIDDSLVNITATVNASYVSVIANATDTSFLGAKLVFHAMYAETITPLSTATEPSFVGGTEGGGGYDGGGGSGSGGASSFSELTGQIALSQIPNTLITPAKLNLNAGLIPTANVAYDLGSSSYRWRDLYLSGSSISLGSATITSTGSAVNLPAGSTINGSAVTAFSTVSVSGQSDLVADTASDTLTFVAGPGISLTTSASTDTITITNTGGGGGGASGVSSGTAGRLAYYASTGSVVQDSGANLSWSGTNLNVTGTVTASGEVSYIRAYFDTLVELQAVNAATWHGMVAHVHENGGRMYYAHGGAWQPIANSSDLNIFKTIAVSGQNSVVADSATDTLTLVAGTNVTITTDATTDTITINAAGGSGGTLDSLTDVVITGTPSIGQVLKYNGSNWINDTDATSVGGGGGTVTSVSGTGTVNGLTLTGTVTSTGNLTLGGTLSNVSLTSAVTGTLPVANGGTGTTTPGLVAGTNVTITGTWPNQTVNATPGLSYSISANGSSDYVFSGPGIVAGNTNDPILYLYKGFTYTFVNTTGGSHPFAIRVSNGGADYTSGVSGSQTGTQVFTVPMNAPSTLYYQCTIHSAMGNVINVV